MQNSITYYRKNNNVEFIAYHNSKQSYPMHTHANHILLGYVTDGEVCIICEDRERLCHTGESFCIMPDILHTIKAVNDSAYSMMTICIPIDKIRGEFIDENNYSNKLKKIILDTPENTFIIDDMALSIGISPYHMIRRFKSVCGLTPHQFQMQCRVRKAQRLLEAGESVTETAYATGFCDQSHFDRCFRKIVSLTPSEYKQSVQRLD